LKECAKVPEQPSKQIRFLPLDYAAMMSFLAYSSSATVTPICLVILSREFSLSYTGGGGIEVMRNLLLLSMLVGSGFVAARLGKPLALALGSFAMGSGLLVYAFAPGYGAILMASGLIGVGGGMIEALLNPLAQDLHPHDSGRYLNFLNAFWSIGVLVTVLLGGELLTQAVSWRLIIGFAGTWSILSGLLFLILNRTMPRGASHSMSDVLGHKLAILRHGRFWLFAAMMFLGAGVEGSYTFWSASYIQIHFGSLPRMGGIGTAFFAGGMIIGRIAAGWFVEQHRLRRLIIGSAVAGLAVSLLVPFITSPWLFFVVLFFAGLTVACFWPSIQSYSVDRLRLEPTAVFILLSCAGTPGFGLISGFMGVIGDLYGLTVSFYALPVLLVLFIAVALAERAWPVHDAA
jgi:fucose permease